jgi:phosphoadenosine phosphosulfate reductase
MFGEIDKAKKSIDLLQEFEPMALTLHSDGYYLAYSGGKDSDAVLQVAIESSVKFTAHYNITGIDPKECVVHIKETRERLAEIGIRLYMEPPGIFTTGPFKGLRKNMWRLIVHKMMPPTRICRYCCSELKEHGGAGRLCLTGVRWEESTSRKKRRAMEVLPSNIKNKKLFNDNDEGRMQFENCMQKGKRVLNPIIPWETVEVWEYLKDRRCPYCILYDCGFDRIGCLGCPMGGGKGMQEDFERYPYVKELYLNAYAKMLEYMWSRGIETSWKNKYEVLEWQMWAVDKEQQSYINGQIDLFEWMGVEEDLF